MSKTRDLKRCCVLVLIPGLSFPRYRQCSRLGIMPGPFDVGNSQNGIVCKQHSFAARVERRLKATQADVKRRAFWHACQRIKRSKPPVTSISPPEDTARPLLHDPCTPDL